MESGKGLIDMHSTRINVSSGNARDLYGIRNKEGLAVRKRLLIRSGGLSSLTEEDIRILHNEYGLKKIIDLRNHAEMVEKPDTMMQGVEYVNISLQKEADHGLAKDEESLRRMKEYFSALRKRLEGDQKEVIKHMAAFYRDMAKDPYTASRLSLFVREVYETERAVIWHCSLGKDRAGLATVVILELLDVDREDIYDDYLYTNFCLYGNEEAKCALDYMERAVKEYLDAFYDEAEKTYGSFEAYLLKMGIDDDFKKKFKNKYLE
ncbi:MAG: tyrosine-protein phosphatase [Erysipelotrichaceae bacterium]|nr:tyrosine-protein phosphatase [Erysipelotrichaceae bacterium]